MNDKRTWREILEPIIQKFRLSAALGDPFETRFPSSGSAVMARLLADILDRLERAKELLDRAQRETAAALRSAERRGYWRGLRDAAILSAWIQACVWIVPKVM